MLRPQVVGTISYTMNHSILCSPTMLQSTKNEQYKQFLIYMLAETAKKLENQHVRDINEHVIHVACTQNHLMQT